MLGKDIAKTMCKLQSCFLAICILAIWFVWLYFRLHIDYILLRWDSHEATGHSLHSHISCNFTSLPQLGKTAMDTFTALEGSKAFIIASYYDDRKGKRIRTLGIVHHQDVKKLYCSFCCTTAMSIHHLKAKIDVHADRFGFPYGLADIVCEEPPDCQPSHIYLHITPGEDLAKLTRFEIRNRERGEFLANFTVCTSPMYGNYSNALQFIQTVELYKLLGAQKVVVYLKSCSWKMKEILDYYSREGSVEVVPWPIQRYLRPSPKWRFKDDKDSDIGYYGQMSAMNDCVYRNMYKSKFVLINDLDEIILPFNHLTWDGLMNHLQHQNPGASIFMFENHVFPQTNLLSWKRVPGVNLLQYIYREPNRPRIFNPKKMIVDPRMVVQTSVHSILKGLGKSVSVSPSVALVHHCRLSWQPLLDKSLLIKDKTIWKYNSSLIKNVNRVIEQLRL